MTDYELKALALLERIALAVERPGVQSTPRYNDAANAREPMVFPNYGRSKNAPISGASAGDLDYYAAGARRTLSDPAKERFHGKERALLAAIEAERARQGDSLGPPPLDPADEDIRF